ncbi:MAG: hypothetical protein PHY48_16895 [Candidatus Cloacimonetes bacterium]|jgi:hypothetical protein|nr:hypothetical protein [Candidatus Cloacimonadota bacterium]
MITNIRKRLFVGLSLIPYCVGSWIIFDRLGKLIAVAVSLMIIGALLAFHADLMSKNKQESNESDKEKR